MLKCGIDVGGTTIKGALFKDIEPVPVKSVSAATKGDIGRNAILGQLFKVIEGLKIDKIGFIGISSAGNIDPETGKCIYATDNLAGWTGTEIKQIVEDRYSLPCKVDNDAVCALKGELTFYPDKKDVTMLTFGTGVGGASLTDGKILRGKNFAAGRWGHLCVEPEGNKCNCGRIGCAETYLSATALLKEGRKVNSELEDVKQLFGLYRSGDAQVEKIIETFGIYLRRLIDQIKIVLSSELIILGGGMAKSKDVFASLLGDTRGEITFAKLGDLAGAYGAANL